MKLKSLTLFSLLAMLLMAFAPREARAERTGMYQATARIVAVGQLSITKGYQFLDIGALFGTVLNTHQEVEETFELQRGQRYAFVAGGDDTARDIDLYLYDDKGERVAKDNDASSVAVVQYTAPRKARYRVVLKLHASRKSSSFCAMTVLTTDRSHSYEMRSESLLDTLLKLEICFQKMEEALEERGNDVNLYYNSGNNSWLIMGAILKHQASVFSDPKRFAGGSYIGICVGEESCSDANIYITNPSGNVLQRGTDSTNFSFVAFEGGSASQRIQMENAYSIRPSLVLSAILRAEEN